MGRGRGRHRRRVPGAAALIRRLSIPAAIAAAFLASRGATALGFALGAHATTPAALVGVATGRYDANWYHLIAAGGYTIHGSSAGTVGFYPGYPLLIRVVGLVVPDLPVAMLLVANACALLAAYVLYRLYEPRWGSRTALIGTGILLCAPEALFLGLGFSESTFLAAVAVTFFFAGRRLWAPAGLAGAAACLVRVNGVLLALPLLVAAYRTRAWRQPLALAAGAAVFAAGAVAYVVYLELAFGDPLLYGHAQAQMWHHHFVNPLTPIASGESRMLHAAAAILKGRSSTGVRYVDAPAVLMDGLMLLVAAGTLVAGFRRLPPEEWLWVLLVALPPLLVFDVPDSISRYLLAAFPIYFLIARLLERVPALALALMLAGLVYQAELAYRLAQGYFVA